MSHHATHSA
jgi:hypothetical protein